MHYPTQDEAALSPCHCAAYADQCSGPTEYVLTFGAKHRKKSKTYFGICNRCIDLYTADNIKVDGEYWKIEPISPLSGVVVTMDEE